MRLVEFTSIYSKGRPCFVNSDNVNYIEPVLQPEVAGAKKGDNVTAIYFSGRESDSLMVYGNVEEVSTRLTIGSQLGDPIIRKEDRIPA